jgi:regulator of cell morphogenesis and NO signaling
MDLRNGIINNESLVTDLVLKDYRVADIFRKYNISYCCGGKIALQAACELHNVDITILKKELTDIMRVIQVSSAVDFNTWNVDFLVDYIIHIHHAYLHINLPETRDTWAMLVQGHQAKYPYAVELKKCFDVLCGEIIPHLEYEEKVIFPYIKQIAHAWETRAPYAVLLVRTLRKPIEAMIKQEMENIEAYLYQFRQLTNNYTAPAGACITHKVALSKLKELDTDLVQHIYLENEILFPRAISIEKELKTVNKNT